MVFRSLVAATVAGAVPLAAAPLPPKPAGGLYLGADLSYVNEMEDCGAVFRQRGKRVDVYKLFAREGANIVRVRIWNDARWTRYSNLADVTKTIRRAKAAGMQVLLDFHYSDDWADGEKQTPPVAWAKLDTDGQARALYDYTRSILAALDRQGLMPEMVQVGNETNPELMGGPVSKKIDWPRNARLFNAGIKAVRDAGKIGRINPRVMLHIAQPEYVEPWFAAASAAGVRDYDVIGISYYDKWSSRTMAELGQTIARVRTRYKADVILVETAYQFTNANADSYPNALGADTLAKDYPASPKGQRDYMIDLTQTVVDNGGIGMVYWEPAWVSTRCTTRWGTGSGWDNAAFFDFRRGNEALPAFDFLSHRYKRPARR